MSEIRASAATLLAASFVVLFQELALIRWCAAQVRVLAYFPNVVLIGAFLALGIGSLLARRLAPLAIWWPVALLFALIVEFGLSRVVFTQQGVSEYLWLLYFDLPRTAPIVDGVQSPIVATFIVCALSFVPLGQIIGRQLALFRERGQALSGYALDLLGSLLGVVAFAAASFAGARPWLWFLVIFAASVVFLRRPLPIAVAAACFAAILSIIHLTDVAEVWSPYYALSRVVSKEDGFLILANGARHQYAVPSRRTDVVHNGEAAALRASFHFPYSLLSRPPKRVLILGAGNGNDAAVALDEGVEQIDAVEIDPVILRMGLTHPDRPYDSPRVRRFNDDARSFLSHDHGKYDLIIFAALDSMTRLSALSNVRLDNFVYTRQCMEAAKRQLAPGGGLILSFATGRGYIDEHLRTMLTIVFGQPPAVYRFPRSAVYLSGTAFERAAADAPPPAGVRAVPTDDWPYLYLRSRSLTPFYLELLAAFGVIACGAIALTVLPRRRGAIHFDGPMFFFGLAFLLLETKSVTEMNLVWGSTWLTSAVVFASILAMVLCGTLWMQWKPVAWPVAVSGLLLAMIVNYLTPVESLIGLPAPIRLLLSLLFVGMPVLFASICFARLFRDDESSDLAFGWNLAGAVAGGLLEFTSMLVGLKAMTLIALAAYIVALTISGTFFPAGRSNLRSGDFADPAGGDL